MAAPRSGLILLLLLLGLLLALRKKPVSSGPAVPSGTVGAVNVSQRGAGMGTHLASKAVNEALLVTVTWTPTTRNQAGAFIPWNYRLEYVIRTAAGALARSGTLATFTGIGQGNPVTSQVSTAGLPLPGQYGVEITLVGMTSDAAGQPVLPYVSLATGAHPLAVQVG